MIGKDTGVRVGEPTSYSTLNASVGFTHEARCAGISAAPSPAEQRIRIVSAMTIGSEGFTSYSCDSTRRPQDQPNCRPARGSKRQPDSDLAGALRHDKRHHAVQANE